MIIIRRKKTKQLQEQLNEEKERNAELAGYSLLPDGPKTKVKNVPDSSKYKEPNGNSCIGYWEERTGHTIKEQAIYYCPACGEKMSKSTDNLDGAHVYKLSSPDKWYFTPLCSKCNNPNNTNVMEVDTVLVPVPPECYEEKE